MNPDIHERACRLLDAWQVEGIAAAEGEWLEAHLADCPACRGRARANERGLQILRSNAVMIDPEVVGLTQARVRFRARELQEEQARLQALWISCGFSWLLGAVTAPLLWEGMAWLGRHFELSPVIWITGFALLWMAPAALAGAAMAWKHARASSGRNHGSAWEP